MQREKKTTEESLIDKISRNIKTIVAISLTQIFNLCNEILENLKISSFTYNVLIFIETLQLLSFAFANKLDYIWDQQVIQYGLEVLNFVQMETILKLENGTLNLLLFYFNILIIIIVYILIGILMCKWSLPSFIQARFVFIV